MFHLHQYKTFGVSFDFITVTDFRLVAIFTERDVNAKLHSKLRSINIAQNQLTTEQMSLEDIRTRASIPNLRPVLLVRRNRPLPIARHLQSGTVSTRLDATIFYYLFS